MRNYFKIEENQDFIRKYPDLIQHYFNLLLLNIAVFCKHPGFKEEKEWRIIHNIIIYNKEINIIDDFKIIQGIPQIIKKIPLKPFRESGAYGISINEILKCVIIGPTQNPAIIEDAISRSMMNAGIENPRERIVRSDIPLRTQH
jgi:hypothetical protein